MPAGSVPRRRHEPYQWFLRVSLITAITIGWLLGTIELSAITFHGAFQDAAARLINLALFQVHGQSQIVGWVGLFIMGISYQVIPRQRRVALHTPTTAYVVLALMASGLALRAICQPLAAASVAAGAGVVASALMELAGVSIFVFALVRGRVMAESIQGPERFSRASLIWFWLALVLNVGCGLYLVLTGQAVVPDWLDQPLLILELFGFITFMIFGVNARNLPLFMPVKAAPIEALRGPLRGLTAGVILTAAGAALAAAGNVPALFVEAAGWAALLGSTAWYVHLVGLIRPRRREVIVTPGRSRWYEAYVLEAYFWLFVGLAIELGAAIAALAGGNAPLGDLFLAGLHGVTVGFISTMIMGMGARIVPAFAASRLYSQKLLVATWVAVTLGTALRVPSQALLSIAPDVFGPLLGVSGIVQLLSLTLFAWNLWATLRLGGATATQTEKAPRLRPTGVINPR